MNLRGELVSFKIAIVSHVFATGPVQELEEYLRNSVKVLLFIGCLFSYNVSDVRAFYKRYEKGCLSRRKESIFMEITGTLGVV